MNELDLEKLFETIKGKGDNVLNDAQKAIKNLETGGIKRKRIKIPITVYTIIETEPDEVSRIVHLNDEPTLEEGKYESIAHIYLDQIVSIDEHGKEACSLYTTANQYLIEKPIEEILKIIDEC